MATKMLEGPPVIVVQDVKPVQDAKEVAEDAKPAKPALDAKPTGDGAEDTKSTQENGEDAKPIDDGVEDTKPTQEHGEDAKPTGAEDTKPTQENAEDAKPTGVEDAKPNEDDVEDAKPTEDDVEDAKPAGDNGKRKNSNKSFAVEKKGKKTIRAWHVDGACVSKEDITCFDLQMSDPFGQLKNSYFAPETTLQMVVIDHKQKGQKKKNMAFCCDEEGMHTCKQNVVMGDICRGIWPDPETSPFPYGAFGSCVLYFSGSTSGAPSSDMPPLAAIDDLIERLRKSNE